MERSRVPLVLLLVAITLHTPSAVAWPQANEVALDGMGFVKDFTEAVTGVLDDEIAALEAKQQANTGWQPADQQRLDELRDHRRKAAGCQPAWQAFSTAKTFATMFKEMEGKVSGLDKWQPNMKVSVDEYLGADKLHEDESVAEPDGPFFMGSQRVLQCIRRLISGEHESRIEAIQHIHKYENAGQDDE